MITTTLLMLSALQQPALCPDSQFGPGARCGVLQRPENPAAPAGRSIPIRYVVLPARNGRSAEPVFLFVGGPGVGSTVLAGLANSVFSPVRETRDFVLVDQRGTGRSNPLPCSADVRMYPARAFGHVFDPALFHRCRS